MEDLLSNEDLLDLQVVDSDIDRLLDRRSSLPELEAYRTAHERLEGLDARIAEHESQQRELDLGSDKASGELEVAELKLQQEERRLYAGGLSARDAEHLRNEVEMLRRQISQREDEVLALMEQREEVGAARQELDEERSTVQADKESQEAAITAAWAEIDRDVARLEAKKAEIVPRIDGDLLALYEELRPTKDGVAAARLAGRVCGGCHLTLSAAEETQVLRATPPRCLHCRRILVP